MTLPASFSGSQGAESEEPQSWALGGAEVEEKLVTKEKAVQRRGEPFTAEGARRSALEEHTHSPCLAEGLAATPGSGESPPLSSDSQSHK